METEKRRRATEERQKSGRGSGTQGSGRRSSQKGGRGIAARQAAKEAAKEEALLNPVVEAKTQKIPDDIVRLGRRDGERASGRR